MPNNFNIPVSEAVQWLFKVATANGAITAPEQAVIVNFAKHYGVDMESLAMVGDADAVEAYAEVTPLQYEAVTVYDPASYDVPKVQRTINDLYRDLRADSVANLKHLITHPIKGRTYGTETIRITGHKMKGICEKHAIDSMIAFIESVGLEKVQSLNLQHGKYALIANKDIDRKYKQSNRRGWYVLSNFPNIYKAIICNEIADAFDLRIVAELTRK